MPATRRTTPTSCSEFLSISTFTCTRWRWSQSDWRPPACRLRRPWNGYRTSRTRWPRSAPTCWPGSRRHDAARQEAVMSGSVERVIFLPGIIMPCALRYAALLRELDGEVDAVAKDLEVYAGPTTPPPGYSIRTEVEGIGRAADAAGFERFHLYGHSGGG